MAELPQGNGNNSPQTERATIPIVPEMNQETRDFIARIERETIQKAPIQPLPPEAREDAIGPWSQLLTKTRDFLGDADIKEFNSADGHNWLVYSCGDKMDYPIKNALFALASATTETKQVGHEDIEYLESKAVSLTREGAVLTITRWANSLTYNEPRPPAGLIVEKTEMGRDEINAMIQTLDTRIGSRSQATSQAEIDEIVRTAKSATQPHQYDAIENLMASALGEKLQQARIEKGLPLEESKHKALGPKGTQALVQARRALNGNPNK
jgi:hypothetical protein